MPTDTIYGIVGPALNKKAVEKIYRLRRRNKRKPLIILIGSLADLKKLGVKTNAKTRKVLKKIWPGKVSVILALSGKRPRTRTSSIRGRQETRDKFKYLHRGTKTLAFRLPKLYWLKRLLDKTGPLVAPSANWEGETPARTIKEAKKYFGDKVDFYVDIGRLSSKPSTLVDIREGKPLVLRKGAVSVK